MITFLNRRLAFSTADVEKYANACEDLAAAGIKYRIKTQTTSGSYSVARSYTGHPVTMG